MKNTESGNALFIVLIAIVLFAGLTMVMANLEGSREFDTDYEEMRSGVTQIMSFAGTLDAAVDKVMTFNSCSEQDLDFHDDGLNSSNYAHVSVNPRCQIFHPKGGGMTYSEVGDSVLDSSQAQKFIITGQQSIQNIGSDENELIFMAFVNRQACSYINDQLGVANLPDGAPPTDDDSQHLLSHVYNNGVSATGGFSGGAALDHTNLSGKSSACFYDSNDDLYIFYSVILAR